jgi:deazaflavin-dependent oxidoreductase (nitroreductase family)
LAPALLAHAPPGALACAARRRLALQAPELSGRSSIDELGEQLAGWGKVVSLETRGRTSGRPVTVAIGYAEEPEGSLLVAAGSPEADWARNLEADPMCTVTIGEASWVAEAEPLEARDAARAVTALILKYGTPAERLGRGPAFRLRRVASS